MLTAPVMLPYFIAQTAIEAFSTPMDPNDKILIDLSPKNRKIWNSLNPAEQSIFRKKLKEDRDEHNRVFYSNGRLRDPAKRKELLDMIDRIAPALKAKEQPACDEDE
jgi:hypothetical protein